MPTVLQSASIPSIPDVRFCKEMMIGCSSRSTLLEEMSLSVLEAADRSARMVGSGCVDGAKIDVAIEEGFTMA